MQTAFVEVGRTLNATAMQRPTIGRAHCAHLGLRRALTKGEVLFKEGEALDCRYRVVSGTILTSTLLGDGRRRIDAFHIPGAVLGLENCDLSSFTAEAIEPATVEVLQRSAFADLPDGDRFP